MYRTNQKALFEIERTHDSDYRPQAVGAWVCHEIARCDNCKATGKIAEYSRDADDREIFACGQCQSYIGTCVACDSSPSVIDDWCIDCAKEAA